MRGARGGAGLRLDGALQVDESTQISAPAAHHRCSEVEFAREGLQLAQRGFAPLTPSTQEELQLGEPLGVETRLHRVRVELDAEKSEAVLRALRHFARHRHSEARAQIEHV